MQAGSQRAPRRHAAGELIEQHDLALVHQVLVTRHEKAVHLQRLAQQLLAPWRRPPHRRQLLGQAGQRGQRTVPELDGAGARHALVVASGLELRRQLRQQRRRFGQPPAGPARRQNQGGDGLVDEHTVGFVDDGRVKTAH